MKSWLKKTANGWQLHVHVQPGARKTGCAGEHGEALKIKIKAPPADGKANEELLGWLRERLQIPARSIALVSGQSSRQKLVALEIDLSEEEVERVLLAD